MKKKLLYIVLLIAFMPIITSGQKGDNAPVKKIIISGYVTDINHEPVSGAVIFIDKNKTDVFTNRKGFYKVKTLPGAESITVFTSGNGAIEVRVAGRTEINFTLGGLSSQTNSENNDTRSDSIVNIGYGSVNKKDLSMSVNRINNNREESPVYSDIYQMLAGKVPGVEVRGKSIIIRGTNSILFGSDPLFVVDNIVVSSIDNVSPIDVKSIEVLKGGAAAIYGSRGSNGVILITLKSTYFRK